MVEGRNDSTSCKGTCEDTMNLGDLVDLVTKAGADTLVQKDGGPSPLLLKLMRDILRKVFKLHKKGKAHGHLCPESILIGVESGKAKGEKELLLCAKLRPDNPCLNSSKTGTDISEWQAPEQRKDPGVRTSSADIYSLGAIFCYCFTGERLSDGWKTVGKSSFVDFPEADDLLSRSLMKEPNLRPIANELQYHPLFWTPEGRLSFLHDIMNRPSYPNYSKLWNELQNLSVDEVTGGEWNEKIHDDKVLDYIYEQNKKSKQKKNLGSKQNKKKACKYNFDSVLDLVRLIRNMKEHYRDLPEDVQKSVGEPPKDFDSFFTSRFPNLVIEVYKVVRKWRKEDKHFGKKDNHFSKYFYGGALVGY